jgi:probable rRNA maturation factor
VRRLADAMLAALELGDCELSVLLTNDREIQELNRLHRDKDKPTDVLSFPLDDAAGSEGTRWLGDVVISIDTAARQALGRKRGLLEEVRFLLAHGILHLIGYDHATKAEKREMDAMTRRLVKHAALEPTAVRSHRKRPASRHR